MMAACDEAWVFLEWCVMGVNPSPLSSLSGSAFCVFFRNLRAMKKARPAAGMTPITLMT